MSGDGPWYDLLRGSGLPLKRRELLALGAASLALAGCQEEAAAGMVAGTRAHPDQRLGDVLHYATCHLVDGFAVGVRARCRDGRPLLITGDPAHPASRGGCGIHVQASLLDLYDPARPRTPLVDGRPASWSTVLGAFARERQRGAGLHLVLPPCSGPVTLMILDRVRERFPELQLHPLMPTWQTGSGIAARAVFGRDLLTVPSYDRVSVLALFDADPFTEGPWAARAAHDHAERRRRTPRPRQHVAEPQSRAGTSLTDHRLAIGAARIAGLLQHLVATLQRLAGEAAPAALPPLAESERRWVERCARDLHAAGRESLVVVGERQPAAAHALAALANELLGSPGHTLAHVPDPRRPLPGDGLRKLSAALAADAVDELVVIGGDPVYASPGALALAKGLPRARRRWYLGDSLDATARLCDRFLPRRHRLEGWGDARALDGSWSLQQAVVNPLHDGLDELGLLALLADVTESPRDLVRAELARSHGPERVDELVGLGVIPGSAATPVTATVDRAAVAALVTELPPPVDGLQLELAPDARLLDGRHAGNAWLQELPDPVTSQCWGNAARLAPILARRLALQDGDEVHIAYGDGELRASVQVVPGTAEHSIVLPLGYGRREGLAECFRVGVDAWPALPVDLPWRPVTVHPTGDHQQLACVQEHWSLEGRDILREKTVAQLVDARPADRAAPHSVRDGVVEGGLQWGMTIDLDTCIGCGSCVIACQGENNVPVVGADLVRRSLEMHWLRIDRYYRADGEDGAVILNMPMACQHCERAPCEYVCPTAATTHSPDGLNEMTYNRCVGTRFCANNCPYKVRRFNFFEYHQELSAQRALAFNPAVSVRARGVMEKCTYCVQRIRETQQDARTNGRAFAAEQVRTACEEACPTLAIRFGDVEDPGNRVQEGRYGPRSYAALAEFGAVPRTRYLARVRNPVEDPS